MNPPDYIEPDTYKASYLEAARTYSAMILGAIERTCLKRIEEIEGRVPSIAEIKEHGDIQVSEGSGIALYLWKDVPIAEFIAGRMTFEGWRDAQLKEIRPALIQTPE